jgi:isoprenylcysteine carboxyl methyltransferase (ICMT) family protein YpbQ
MVVQVAGYTTALVFVRQTTRLTPVGIADHYRGSENAEGAMQFPKSFSEMLVITHTHLLSMAVVFVLSGIALALCERVPDRWKGLLCVEPFVAMLVSFSAMWLMRYVDPRFSLLLALSSGIMALTFYIQTVFIFRELGWRDRP